MIRFDTLKVQKEHRARQWRDTLDQFYCRADYNIRSDFQNGRLEGFCVDGIGAGHFASDPINGMRTRSLIAREPVDAYVVVLADKCPIIMSQGGRVVRVEQKGFAFISTAEPSSYHQFSAGAHRGLMIPGDLLRRLAPRIDDRVARPFGPEPLHQMFYAMASEWSVIGHAMAPVVRSLVAKSIVELLGLAIDGADHRSSESIIRRSHRQRIESLIEEGYADPAFGPASVARRMNLSARYLRTIMAAEGKTIGHLIKERRVAEALGLFGFGAAPHRSPQTIAQTVGYTDVGQLHRDMEAVGGCQPAQLAG